MAQLNRLTINGRLVKDPEEHEVGEKKTKKVVARIANDTGFGDHKRTGFFDVEAFGKTGEILKGFKKGDGLVVDGQLAYFENPEKNFYKTYIAAELVFAPQGAVRAQSQGEES